MSVTIYHNPRCSKSRQTLQLLQDRGIQPHIIEYLQSPPDVATLRDILAKLGMASARDLMRKNEPEYTEGNLAAAERSEDELLTALRAQPKLMERPVVMANGKAAIGRPPENVLDIL